MTLNAVRCIDVTPDDLSEIESAISKITVLGERYPEEIKKQWGH
jgi:hypothetical protein